MRYWPEVVQAVPGPGLEVYAYFSDGAIRRIDVSHLVHEGSAFASLADRAVFVDALTVTNGTVAWDLTGKRDLTEVLDIDPLAIYDSDPVADPLGESD